MASLPTPVTTTDELLSAVLSEIVGLRADLAKDRGGEPPAVPAGTQVELTEPKPRTTPRPRR